MLTLNTKVGKQPINLFYFYEEIIFFLLGISFLTSCSGDSEQPENTSWQGSEALQKSGTSDPIDPVLKDLYIKMINSQSYIAYENAINDFDSKLGNKIPDSERLAGANILRWVQNNLSLTGFTSYPNAVSQYNNVVNLAVAEANANYQFHEYLNGSKPGLLIPILEEQQPVEPNNCPKCTTARNNCTNAANSTYRSAVAKAAASLRKGDIGEFIYKDACTEARINKDSALSSCIRTFNACCNGY